MNASDRAHGAARADHARRRLRLGVWLTVAVSFWLCLNATGAQPAKLFDADGLRNAGDILSGLMRPDLSADFLERVWQLSVESLLIGVLGTALAVVLASALAFLATRLPELPDPPRRLPPWQRLSLDALRTLARLLLGLFRSIPEIIWALVFVRLLGLGPGAAVMAIGLTMGGNMGKLFAELAEATDPRALRALQAGGASRWAVFCFGVLPQVRRAWTGYALFCLECNIRLGTVLGVVGAGGLGSEMALSIRYFQYDRLATTLLAVLVLVVGLEALSTQLRRRPTAWAVGLGAVGAAVALWRLEIPWRDLWSSPAVPLFTLDDLHVDLPFVQDVLAQMGETLAMAWVATLVSAALALMLAPLASQALMQQGYLSDAPRPGAGTGLLRGAVRAGVRLLLQFTRVMPELTLALVFVVWVGGGPLAGMLAIAVHNTGVMGRLYADVLDDVEPRPAAVLQAQGAGVLATFLFGVLPAIGARLTAMTLYRFEVNLRATAMVGFVGAGGIGDALNTAISLFHLRDLTLLLIAMVALIAVVDAVGDRLRARLLRHHGRPGATLPVPILHSR